MKHLDRDNRTLAFVEEGKADPPVVLLHGMACDHTHLLPQLEHLSPRHRTVAFDLRGHGQSYRPGQRFSIDAFADDLSWLCDELSIDRPVLIGHSLGGSIALAYAAQHPDRVRALALLDSGVRSPEMLRSELSAFYDTLGGRDHARLVREFVRERLFEPTDGAALADSVAELMASQPAEVFLAIARNVVLELDSRAAALACTVPSLLILAARPFANSADVAGLGPNWRVGRTVGSGHFVQLVVPDQVNAMLDRFLAL
jgi:pimeloyl-ACP methyl ester carboxylesterase